MVKTSQSEKKGTTISLCLEGTRRQITAERSEESPQAF
jgi:hypothetical protein